MKPRRPQILSQLGMRRRRLPCLPRLLHHRWAAIPALPPRLPPNLRSLMIWHLRPPSTLMPPPSSLVPLDLLTLSRPGLSLVDLRPLPPRTSSTHKCHVAARARASMRVGAQVVVPPHSARSPAASWRMLAMTMRRVGSLARSSFRRGMGRMKKAGIRSFTRRRSVALPRRPGRATCLRTSLAFASTVSVGTIWRMSALTPHAIFIAGNRGTVCKVAAVLVSCWMTCADAVRIRVPGGQLGPGLVAHGRLCLLGRPIRLVTPPLLVRAALRG
jgi:hypothetical protein